jgi:hypothetical protein
MLERIASCEPFVSGLTVARACGLHGKTLSHAGPPFVDREAIPKPVLHALAGAAVMEGWVSSLQRGINAVLDGDIDLVSNHALGIVSPMAGVVRPSQPLFVLQDAGYSGRQTYATLAEKGRRTLRFGCFDADVVSNLAVLEHDIARDIEEALPSEGLPILPIVAEGIALGDDVHQRNVGGHLVFLRSLPKLSPVARTYLADHTQFFLNFAMAAAKMVLDGWRGFEHSTLVTAISRNGVECGIQVAGTGDRWFTAPSVIPEGGIFPPHTADDAQPDLGDSAIMEAFGLGGCIAHLAPELTHALSVPLPDAVAEGRRQRHFFRYRHDRFSSVASGLEGVGIGLDAQRALEGEEEVRIHTGIAHRDGKSGWIGVGVARVPRACFAAAIEALGTEQTESAIELP